jgi:STE24 endopeptidase
LWQAQLPGPVDTIHAAAVFTPRQIQRAKSYRELQYVLVLVGLVAPALVAWLLVWRGGTRLALGRRPVVRAAGAAFLVSVITTAVVIPIGYITHVRASNRGLDLESTSAWLATALVTLVITAVLVAAVYVGAWLIARGSPRPWFAVGLAAWVAVAVVTVLQPVLWDPLLLSTRPLPRTGRAAVLVRQLETRMGVHPQSVSVADAGSKTTEENAFVDGVGPTERVVIYDTSLRDMSRDQLRALIAHEFGHIKRRHTLKGVLWFGVLALPALWLIWRLLDPIARRRYADGLLDPRATALVLAGVLTASALLTPVENLISRRDEAEADWAGLQATRDGAGMASLQRRLALTNLSNPVPSLWAVWTEFNHPPVMDRIEVARSYSTGGEPNASSTSSSRSNSGRLLIPSRVRHFE